MTDRQGQEDPWDSICVNPYEAEIEVGRSEGKEAGLEAGFKEGYQLGRTTAIEFGMELGFMRGALMRLKELNCNDEKLVNKIDSLLRLIEDFPRPDQVFRQRDSIQTEQPSIATLDDSEVPMDELDVNGRMQRIRARFKLQMVQLGYPHFSLKQLMDNVAVTFDHSKESSYGEW